MQTKLTLHLDAELIQRAEAFAKQQNKSVSQLVVDYFQSLSRPAKTDKIPPITQSLIGILQGHQIDEDGYKQ